MKLRVFLSAIFLFFSTAAFTADYQSARNFDTIKPYGSLNKEEAINWIKANDPELSDNDARIFASSVQNLTVEYLDKKYGKEKDDACQNIQTVFIRRDRLDTYQFRANNEQAAKSFKPRKESLGANVSFTHDSITGADSLSVNGRVSAIFYRLDTLSKCKELNRFGANEGPNPPTSGIYRWLVAGYIDGQGTKTSPIVPSEQSIAQAGLEFQTSIADTGLFRFHYLTFSPYALTDFRGDGLGHGFRFGWEPINADYRLGGRPSGIDEIVDWYWLFRGEVDARDVEKTGFTKLGVRQYNWVGGYATVKFKLFPSSKLWDTPYTEIADRFYGALTYQYHWDSQSELNVKKYGAELGYNLTLDGTASFSGRYTEGNDKDNLARVRKTVFGLNIKY